MGVFFLFWWVQTCWLLSFYSMLFFGPSFSHFLQVSCIVMDQKRYQSNWEGMENTYIHMVGPSFSYLTVIYSIYFGLYQRKNHLGYVYSTSSIQICIQISALCLSQIPTIVYKSNRISYSTKELKQYRPRNFIMPRFNKEMCGYIDSLGIRRNLEK